MQSACRKFMECIGETLHARALVTLRSTLCSHVLLGAVAIQATLT